MGWPWGPTLVPDATPDELPGLARILLRRRLMWGLFIGGMPLVYLSDRLLTALVPASSGTRTFEVAGYVWMVAWGVSVVLVALSRCPRCGGYFHIQAQSLPYARWWTKKCVNCDLPITRRRPADG
jgi:hypothetical protein